MANARRASSPRAGTIPGAPSRARRWSRRRTRGRPGRTSARRRVGRSTRPPTSTAARPAAGWPPRASRDSAASQARERAHREAADAVGDQPLAARRRVAGRPGPPEADERLTSGRPPARAGGAGASPSPPARQHRGAARLLDELGHERRPAGLVAGAQPGAGVAVEVLVEQDAVAPVRVVVCRSSPPPRTGRRPAASRRKSASRRRDRSSATWHSVSARAGAGRALDREVRRRSSGGTAAAPR